MMREARHDHFAVGVISDYHFGKSNALTASLYEMLAYSRFDVLIRNGDGPDAWELGKGRAFTPLQICTLDLMNRHAREGTFLVDHEGNHNLQEALPENVKEAARVGLNVYPASVIIDHENRRHTVLHGHQFDNQEFDRSLGVIADNEYARIAATDPDSASFGKIAAKFFLKHLGYNLSYRFGAASMNTNHLIMGHRHMPEERSIHTPGLKENLRDAFARFAIRQVPLMARAFSKPLIQSAVIGSSRKLKLGKILDIFERAAVFLETKPDLSLLGQVSYHKHRPKYSRPLDENSPWNNKPILFTDAGSWIDGNTTLWAMDHKGQGRLIDWSVERMHRGLHGPAPTDDEWVEAHRKRYGGLLTVTQDQLNYYNQYVSGRLSDDQSEELSVLPDPRSVLKVRLSPVGHIDILRPGDEDTNYEPALRPVSRPPPAPEFASLA